jgi:sucrose-6F-phosphate phosphohydrolase
MRIKLITFDIDETLIDNSVETNDFYKTWNRIKFKEPPLLCYNSGRLPDDLISLIERKIIPEPDYFIAGVGTSIYDYRKKILIKEFSQVLDEGWDLAKVILTIADLENGITPQPDHFQNDFKSSWYYDNASEDEIEGIKKKLKNAGLEVNVVYSSSRHLDILPKWANKGNSLEWLLKYLKVKPEETIVAGDSGNDSAMFKIPQINGIVVGNAQPELYHETKGLSVYYSEKPRYEAVLEGLQQYGLAWELIQPEETAISPDFIDFESINLMEEVNLEGINKNQLKLIR